jgi:hypothetical protein
MGSRDELAGEIDLLAERFCGGLFGLDGLLDLASSALAVFRARLALRTASVAAA